MFNKLSYPCYEWKFFCELASTRQLTVRGLCEDRKSAFRLLTVDGKLICGRHPECRELESQIEGFPVVAFAGMLMRQTSLYCVRETGLPAMSD